MHRLFPIDHMGRGLMIGAIVVTSVLTPRALVDAAEPLPYPTATPSDAPLTTSSASFAATDLRVHGVFEPGDVFVTAGNGHVLWFLPDGTLNRSLSTGTTDLLTGMGFDLDGNLYVTAWSADRVFKFAPDGSLVGTFGTGYDCWPESIAFDGAGSAYVGQAQCTKDILNFDASGALQRSFDVPAPGQANFVARAADECTLYYTSEGTAIRRVDICSGDVPSDWATIPNSRLWGLKVLPDGRVIAAADSDVKLLSDGQVVRSFDVPGEDTWFNVAISPDGDSFWAVNAFSPHVYHFSVDTGELLSQFDSGAPFLTTYGIAVFGEPVLGSHADAAGPPVMFVHGINGNFRLPSFDAVLDTVRAEFPGSLRLFEYYQDRGSIADDGRCVPRDPMLPVAPNDGMPVALDSIDPNVCDSQSDLALNAVLLAADVRRAYEESGEQKVVLVAHSMGAAITRGFLAYSAEIGDGIAQSMVDSVFFLEGAQDGSEVSRQLFEDIQGGFPEDALAEFVTDRFGLNFTRPAAPALLPESDWYRWVNPDAGHLPDVGYVNVYGDIDVVTLNCFFWFCGDPTVFMQLGDGVMRDGTDDPQDVPAIGGARFLRGNLGPQNWQWQLPAQAIWNPGNDPQFIGVIAQVASMAENHAKFSSATNEIVVSDCRTGEAVALDEALRRLLLGRLRSQPYECVAGEEG